MVAFSEAKTGPSPLLLENVTAHLDAVSPLIKATPSNRDILWRTREHLKTLPELDAIQFFKDTPNWANKVTRHLGNNDVNKNGLTFGASTKDGQNLLIRYYLSTTSAGEVPSEILDDLRQAIINDPTISHFYKWQKRGPARKTLSMQVSDVHFYAGAEIMTRTLLHAKLKGKEPNQPLPTALVDSEGEPVGFILTFGTLPQKSGDAQLETIDTFFDFWPGDTYGLSSQSPQEALVVYEALKKVNSVPYAERGQDLKKMMIYGGDDRFLTFNRIGYATEEIGLD